MSHNKTSDPPGQMAGGAVFGHLDLPAERETERETEPQTQREFPKKLPSGCTWHGVLGTEATFTYQGDALWEETRGSERFLPVPLEALPRDGVVIQPNALKVDLLIGCN